MVEAVYTIFPTVCIDVVEFSSGTFLLYTSILPSFLDTTVSISDSQDCLFGYSMVTTLDDLLFVNLCLLYCNVYLMKVCIEKLKQYFLQTLWIAEISKNCVIVIHFFLSHRILLSLNGRCNCFVLLGRTKLQEYRFFNLNDFFMFVFTWPPAPSSYLHTSTSSGTKNAYPDPESNHQW